MSNDVLVVKGYTAKKSFENQGEDSGATSTETKFPLW